MLERSPLEVLLMCYNIRYPFADGSGNASEISSLVFSHLLRRAFAAWHANHPGNPTILEGSREPSTPNRPKGQRFG